jgi:hypothetical protein
MVIALSGKKLQESCIRHLEMDRVTLHCFTLSNNMKQVCYLLSFLSGLAPVLVVEQRNAKQYAGQTRFAKH